MIDRSETKHIPGPEWVRGYVSPTLTNVNRLRCATCGQFAIQGHDIVHSQGCAWKKWQDELQVKRTSIDNLP